MGERRKRENAREEGLGGGGGEREKYGERDGEREIVFMVISHEYYTLNMY